MGECVIIYGQSGSGKSRSLLNFAEDEVFVVNVIGKRFPFAKKFKYIARTDDPRVIIEQLAKMPCKTAVIDDAGYISTNAFMRGHSQGDQFKLYNAIGDNLWCLINAIKTGLPDDVIVYMVFHEDRDETGFSKLRTIGKLLDQKVCIEGMVTIVLRCMIKGGQHIFLTNSDGTDIAKSPEGMFEETIANDLKFVDDTVRKYWGMEIRETKKGTK